MLSPGGAATSSAQFVVLRAVAPTLTMAASPSTITRGRRIRLTGRLSPVHAGGSQVTIVVQRRQAGVWRTATSSSRTPDTSGSCTWSYRPRRAGAYRARASFGGPPAVAASLWVAFRVR